MVDILPLVLLLIVILLAVGQVAAVIYLELRQREFLERLGKAVGLSEEEKERFKFWRNTQKKSEAILGEAELEGVKIVADTKYYTKELSSVYHDQLRLATGQMEDEFKKFLGDLRHRSEKEAAGQGRVLVEAADEAVVAFTKELEAQLAKANDETAAYKQKLMEKAKADMAGLVEEVAKTVISRQLSDKDQEELISEAFERAKSAKWI